MFWLAPTWKTPTSASSEMQTGEFQYTTSLANNAIVEMDAFGDLDEGGRKRLSANLLRQVMTQISSEYHAWTEVEEEAVSSLIKFRLNNVTDERQLVYPIFMEPQIVQAHPDQATCIAYRRRFEHACWINILQLVFDVLGPEQNNTEVFKGLMRGYNAGGEVIVRV